MENPRVIVALDFPDAHAAQTFAEQLSPALCRLKVGMELFTAAGPKVVENLVSRGFDVFLDLKYHDIPTTVARACTQAASLGVWMLCMSWVEEMLLAAPRRLIVWPAARCDRRRC
jgi:orotidine-5'-phosphate decarboxylase